MAREGVVMPIYPHTVEEHGAYKMEKYKEGLVCSECGFCQCEELEGIHAIDCSSYDYSGAGDGYVNRTGGS